MSIEAVDRNNPLPRYLQAKLIIQRRICAGKYRPGDKLPGERELAAELRISQMTMNKALMILANEGWVCREHGKGTFVPEDFLPPVPEVLQLGVVVQIPTDHALEDFYLGGLFRGMQRALANEQVSLSIVQVPPEHLVERLQDALLDGLLMLDMWEPNVARAQQLYESGVKMVVLGASWEGLDAPYVDSDNFGGTVAAVKHLINLGHRRIGGVFALPRSCNTQHRMRAFQQTLRAHRVEVDESFVIVDEKSYLLSDEGREQVRRALCSPKRPTAFFCGGYYLALEVMRIARETDLHVPKDLSLVGFDDPVSAVLLTPPLTTVRQPLDEMGRLATLKLMKWLTSHQPPQRSEVLPTQLIVRGSTAPAAGR